jgi:hypothetical protein
MLVDNFIPLLLLSLITLVLGERRDLQSTLVCNVLHPKVTSPLLV